MLFAEDLVGPVGWIAIATAVIGAGSTAVVAYLNTKHKNKQEQDATAITQWKDYADRLDTALTESNKETARARVADMACRDELAEQRAALLVLYGFCDALHRAAADSGMKVPPMPSPPPARANRASVEEAMFAARTQAHDSGLLKSTRPAEQKP